MNLTDHVDCKGESVAKYVELYLKSLLDKLKNTEDLKKEVCEIKMPKERQKLEEILEEYENMEKEVKKLPDQIKSLEEQIDREVCQLYGLSKDDIAVIEESVRG